MQLFGSSPEYLLDFLPGSTGNLDAKLIYDPGASAGSELIALIENVTDDLSLRDSAFVFV